MFTNGTLYIIPFISGVEGADVFNFFFSLVTGRGVIVVYPCGYSTFNKL
jgi:hypothetical protein